MTTLMTRRLAYLKETNRDRMEHLFLARLVLRWGVVVFRGTEVDDGRGRYADHPRERRLLKISV